MEQEDRKSQTHEDTYAPTAKHGHANAEKQPKNNQP
jgi:hypothetical protein